MTLPFPAPETWERLERRSTPEPNSGCWLWLGTATPGGYGRVSIGGGVADYAHRAAYQLAHGRTIPEGMQIDHKCRVRCCWNPAHLELVTPQENLLRSRPYRRKDVCKNGHPRTPENTVRGGDGRPRCRACVALNIRKKRLARNAAKPNTRVYLSAEQAQEILESGLSEAEAVAKYGISRATHYNITHGRWRELQLVERRWHSQIDWSPEE